MLTRAPIINSFTAGELSRHMDGRTDHEKYYSGCRRLENFIPRPHGSVSRRPGTHFIAEARAVAGRERLIPFDFNSTASQSYVLELCDGVMRFFTDGGVIIDSHTRKPIEVKTPWSQEQLDRLNSVQSADVMYFAHPNVRPHKLVRHAHDEWSLEPILFYSPGWDFDLLNDIGAPKGRGNPGETFTLPKGTLFESGWLVRQSLYSQPVWFKYIGKRQLDATEKTLHVKFTNSPDKDSPDEIESIHPEDGKVDFDNWKVLWRCDSMPECWKDESWPSCIGFYEDRLVLAATPERPLTLWLSRTGGYEDYRLNTSIYQDGVQGEPLDDDAIEITLSGSRVNPIRWLMDQEHLLVGTNASEVKVWSGSEGEGMTPAKCQRKRQSAHGSAGMPAQLISSAVLYVSRSRRKIRELTFDYTSFSYAAPELTLLAEHITGPGIREMDYADEPDGVLWCVREDGELVGCTYLAEENVRAWHRHPLGGDGRVESVAVIPGESGDEVWLLVRRTIGGREKRYIERLLPHVVRGGGETERDDAAEAFYLDCGLSYQGSPRDIMNHLDHLEGEMVDVLADGCVVGPRRVTNGRIELDRRASRIHVGLGYSSVLQPMRLEMSTGSGTSQTRRKRVMGVTFRFLETVGGRVCSGDDRAEHYESILTHGHGVVAGKAPKLFSGDRQVRLSGGFDRDGLFTVRQDDPLPMTIICLVPEVVGEQ